MKSKEELRKLIRKYRASIPKEEAEAKSMLILKQLFNRKEYEQAVCIYCYLDTQNEVMTKPLLERAWSEGKRVAVPKIQDKDIQFYYIQSYDETAWGKFGILEPFTSHPAKEEDALFIMPGLAFDKENHRIGYGGGYYDRYLKCPNRHYKIALAYQFQVFDAIEYEEFDISPDLVLTESEQGVFAKGGDYERIIGKAGKTCQGSETTDGIAWEYQEERSPDSGGKGIEASRNRDFRSQ